MIGEIQKPNNNGLAAGNKKGLFGNGHLQMPWREEGDQQVWGTGVSWRRPDEKIQSKVI